MKFSENRVVLSVKGLKKSYPGIIAVNNLSFDVKKGEVFGLLGHNGAGKSTTIECILGTKKMDEGHVSILGMDPKKDRKQLFEKVGVQFQQSVYQDKIKVKEVCQLTASLFAKTSDWKELLKDFSLEDKANRLIEELSGGERQKLSVLLAFIHRPEIVFLDELTTGLDSKARRDIWKYIKLLSDQGVTVFLTSHYMDEVEFLCDQICILKRGVPVIKDSPQDVILQSGKASLEEAYLYFSEEEI